MYTLMDDMTQAPKGGSGLKGSAKRFFWLSLGLICVAIGALGLFVPLLPTTSFLLLAAFSFARSSPRLHGWLLNHKVFGPLIRDWQMHRAIGTRAKVMCLTSMLAIVLISIFLSVPAWVLGVQVIVLGCVAFFIVTRPTPPQK